MRDTERIHKHNNFHNSSLQVYKEWSYLVRTMAHLAPCSFSDDGIKELIREVITCSPFPHIFCNILFTMTHQQSCNSPLRSSSMLRCMPPADSSILSNLSIRSHIFCVLTQTHLAHLIHLLETTGSVWESLQWLHRACQLWTIRFTPLPLGSLLNFSVGP